MCSCLWVLLGIANQSQHLPFQLVIIMHFRMRHESPARLFWESCVGISAKPNRNVWGLSCYVFYIRSLRGVPVLTEWSDWSWPGQCWHLHGQNRSSSRESRPPRWLYRRARTAAAVPARATNLKTEGGTEDTRKPPRQEEQKRVEFYRDQSFILT